MNEMIGYLKMLTQSKDYVAAMYKSVFNFIVVIISYI